MSASTGGIGEGQEVTAAFDPMLAKVIVSGVDRNDAMAKADRALADYVLLGCRTNTAFLRRLVNHPAFIAGDVHTGFLDANPAIAAEPAPGTATVQALLGAAALHTRSLRDPARSGAAAARRHRRME